MHERVGPLSSVTDGDPDARPDGRRPVSDRDRRFDQFSNPFRRSRSRKIWGQRSCRGAPYALPFLVRIAEQGGKDGQTRSATDGPAGAAGALRLRHRNGHARGRRILGAHFRRTATVLRSARQLSRFQRCQRELGTGTTTRRLSACA